jgi:hypothetical protein
MGSWKTNDSNFVTFTKYITFTFAQNKKSCFSLNFALCNEDLDIKIYKEYNNRI